FADLAGIPLIDDPDQGVAQGFVEHPVLLAVHAVLADQARWVAAHRQAENQLLGSGTGYTGRNRSEVRQLQSAVADAPLRVRHLQRTVPVGEQDTGCLRVGEYPRQLALLCPVAAENTHGRAL